MNQPPSISLPFDDQELVEELVIISDVDGVIREHVNTIADQAILKSFKNLLQSEKVHVSFISGTAVENDLKVDLWRRGNIPLSQVFGEFFDEEIHLNQLSIYGVLGGHRLKQKGGLEIVDEYSIDLAKKIASLLIEAFLKEVSSFGTDEQKEKAKELNKSLAKLDLTAFKEVPLVTPEEFYPIVKEIRETLDPNFGLISNGSLIETHSTNPLWTTKVSFNWIKEELKKLPLKEHERHVSTGIAKKDDHFVNFLLISKTHKGLTTDKLIEENKQKFPKALIITIGDTAVDFPMHEKAHLSFHVGLKEVLDHHPMKHCFLITDSNGNDSQHLKGTLKVLQFLQDNIGKSFKEFKQGLISIL